jgi:uncharacterized protein YfaS (alpha-2-macroglobulin family)
MEGERPKSPIEVATDKNDYYTGEIVNVNGYVPELTNGHEVNIIVKDANGETFTKLRIKPTDDNGFAASFKIPSYSKLFPVGKWTINVSYAIWAAKVYINVLASEKMSMNSVTISIPEISGKAIDGKIKVGDEITVTLEIKNNAQRERQVFYIVQVNNNSTTVMLDWVSKIIHENETVRLSISWIPELEGKYIVHTFVWSDIVNPTPLSSAQSTELTVSK